MLESPQIIAPAKIRRLMQPELVPFDAKPDERLEGMEGLPREIEAKRSAIFNADLKDLVDRVKSPQVATSLPLTRDILLQTIARPVGLEKEEEFRLLQNLYIPGSRIQESALLDITEFLLSRSGLDCFSWHFLSYDAQAYFSEIAQGMDIVTRKNFIFSENDPYIQSSDPGFFELEITSDLPKDPFFAKKFSVETLSYLAKIYFFFVREPGVNACLVAFLEKEKPLDSVRDNPMSSEVRNRWLHTFRSKIPILIPALARYRSEKLNTRVAQDDMMTRTIHAFKTVLGQGLPKAIVHNVFLRNYQLLENGYYLKKQFLSNLLGILGPKEKILELGTNRFLILSEQNREDLLSQWAKSDNLDLEIQTKVYPDFGENILLYI